MIRFLVTTLMTLAFGLGAYAADGTDAKVTGKEIMNKTSGVKGSPAREPNQVKKKQCDFYLGCEATYCGAAAYKRCMNGQDPMGRDAGSDDEHLRCEYLLTCEATYCGSAAYKRCLRGQDPAGDDDSSGNSAVENKCSYLLTCEATYCGATAYSKCLKGKSPK